MQAITFAKRSFLLMGSSFLRMLVQLAIIILYSKKLSITDYGLYQSVWMYVNIFSLISLFGLPSLLLSNSPKNVLFWIKQHVAFFASIAAILNFLPILYVFFAANDFNISTKCLLVCLIVVQNVAIIMETLIIKREKERLLFITNLIFIVGYFVCHLVVLDTTYSIDTIIVGIIFLTIIKIFHQWKFSKQATSYATIENDEQIGKQWFYLGINDIVGVIFKWVDKWFILLFISLSQFAIYFNGSYEIPLYGLMISAVGNIMLVEYSKSKADLNKKTKAIFENSTKFLSYIVFPSFCFLLFFYDDVFRLVFGGKFETGIPVFLITIFLIPLRITNFTTVLQVLNKSNLILKGAILDLVIALLLMLALYPILGLKGLALACVVSTYIQAAYYLWHTSKLVKEKISYFIPFRNLITTMLISLFTIGIFFWVSKKIVQPYNILFGFICASILIVLFLLYNYKKIKNNINH